jgi:hypothetical protein
VSPVILVFMAVTARTRCCEWIRNRIVEITRLLAESVKLRRLTTSDRIGVEATVNPEYQDPGRQSGWDSMNWPTTRKP